MTSIVLAIVIAGCLVAACSAPAGVAAPAYVPGWPDVGTPPATVATREIDFNREDKGAWRDEASKPVERVQ